jgi:cellulose biosynthesis protein BcsQ
MAENLEKLLYNFKKTIAGEDIKRPKIKYKSYTITNFRGGIGKSTLAFNIAFELSRENNLLLADVCPQCNLTQALLGEDVDSHSLTIYDALLPYLMPAAKKAEIDDLLLSVPAFCHYFKQGKKIYNIPGSKELFLFPSLLYTQLNSTANIGTRAQDTGKNILASLDSVLKEIGSSYKISKTLIDTSPFFGGATHLAWLAADALIIPVRVDQPSMDALRLTLEMLRNKSMDFLRLNEQFGIDRTPKIHAIVMTHCGWGRQFNSTPDRSTQSFLTQLIDIIADYKDLFSYDDPLDTVHLLDDFHSAGRISGAKRIPLAKLHVGQSFTIQAQRLEVNESLTRYQRELKALANTL